MRNKFALQMIKTLQSLMLNPLTSRFCIKVEGSFSNLYYETVSFSYQHSMAEDSISVELTVRPVMQTLLVAFPKSLAALGTIVLTLDEEDLLPWNITDRFMWPKYPHLFTVASAPNLTDWLEAPEGKGEHEVALHAVKLNKGANMMPIGVKVNSFGEHCYIIAATVHKTFDSLNTVAYYPIGTYHQNTIPQFEFNVTG